jgi:hypothetical protein
MTGPLEIWMVIIISSALVEELFVKKRFKANILNLGISDDGQFAVCQTARSDDKSDSSKLYFFDVINRKNCCGKKSPDTGGQKAIVSIRIIIFYTSLYDENRAYRYTFDGDITILNYSCHIALAWG